MIRHFLLLFALLFLASPPALALERNIAPEAEDVLKGMCDFMANIQSYTVRTNLLEDRVYPNGMKIKHGGASSIAINKPAQLRADAVGYETDRLTIINGTKMVILNRASGIFQEIEVPEGLAPTMDFLLEKYDVNIPTADLLTEDPYTAISSGIITGEYVGLEQFRGIPSHHLAFRQLEVDWELWIADGENSLPLRIVITDKTQVGHPQYMLELYDWDLTPAFDEETFSLSPSDGAVAGEVLLLIDNSEGN